MRTKFLTTAALATLLTVGTTAVALAQAADLNYQNNPDQISDLNQSSSQAVPGTWWNTHPHAGISAHTHPHWPRRR
jgi:hypothetical protein